ncbi:nitrate/nitrite two-component system sensor histidine kinase [Alteromonas alba]|uniref:Sensor protein n=1 Tax=Alteromonas alba TaxID=2079529 RepID=A0A2S9V5F3_9ALTE|nr:ATP-binding protein [Alteromonas alba]PRO71671.1 nitrate/nitrite two-component system sensor histidine kinase [Alteromonas alba]
MQPIKNFIHSTVFKIAALMFSVSFLAIVSMFTTVFMSDGAQFDAQAVNVAGSLRMQTYRIHSVMQDSPGDIETINQLVDEFDLTLNTGVLVNQQALWDNGDIAKHHAIVVNNWNEQVKPLIQTILASPSNSNTSSLEVFNKLVEDIELLVVAYQKYAEINIANIRLVQSLALFSTLILIAIAMMIVHRHIEQPLSKLTSVARQIGQGDFTAKAEETGKGELALLARTINKMSGSLYRSKSQLEEQIKRKTRKLTRSNKSLELLFQVSRRLNEVEPGSVDFQPLLNKLVDVTGVKDLDLCIMTAQGTNPYEHLVSTEKTIPDKCQQHLCHDCTEHDSLFPPINGHMKYQLKIGDQHYGVLSVSLEEGNILEDWQHQLFAAIAEQVANGLSMKHQNEQRRRIALMNERTVIARELHDSLAQALSYLKIQVTRLQRLQQKESAQEQIDQVIDELKNGLGAAYSELRELLTTFRLKLDGQGIKAALEQTISQLQNRSDDFNFTLNYHVSNIPFTPQEEIHLLQIAREATQNAFYHSQGSNIDISITSNSLSEVILTVKDNGIGIPEDPNKLNHYGLAIMKERSRNLDGELSVKRNDERGTTVMFSFIPEYARTLEVKSKSA